MSKTKVGAVALAMAAGCAASVAVAQQVDVANGAPIQPAGPATVKQVKEKRFGGYVTPRSIKINGVEVPFTMVGAVADTDAIVWDSIGATAGGAPDDLMGIAVLDDVTFGAPGTVGSQKLEGVRFSFTTASTMVNPSAGINVGLTWFNTVDQSVGATSVASNPNVGLLIDFAAPTTGWAPDSVYTLNGFAHWFLRPITVGPAGAIEMVVLDTTGTLFNDDFGAALSTDPVTIGTSSAGAWSDDNDDGFYADSEAFVLVDAQQQPLPTALRMAIELQVSDASVGACCLGDGSCVALTSSNCSSQAGAVFRGAGTKCETASPTCFPAGVLWNNGRLATGANSAGGTAAPAGTQWSEAPNDGTCVSGIGGIALARASGVLAADDFVIPAGQSWAIQDIAIFAYQTNAGSSVSPFNLVHMRIWNGVPDAPGSTIVFGDLTTNRYVGANATFSGLWRTLGSTLIAGNPAVANRALWQVRVPVNATLPAGHYWVDYGMGATNGGAHFGPVVSVMQNGLGVLDINGNARQFVAGAVGPGFDGWYELGEDGFGLVAGTTGCLAHAWELPFVVRGTSQSTGPTCYANCDNSTNNPFLNVADFTCFLQKFAASELPYANCDNSTNVPVLNVADFTCFLQKFAAGCSAP